MLGRHSSLSKLSLHIPDDGPAELFAGAHVVRAEAYLFAHPDRKKGQHVRISCDPFPGGEGIFVQNDASHHLTGKDGLEVEGSLLVAV